MIEEWKDIAGYEGIYQVSSFGRVKSLDRMIAINCTKQIGYRRFRKGSLIRPRCNNKGYEYVDLKSNGKATRRYIHRLVAEHFIENPSLKKEVNHKDFNKRNNAVKNLEWVDKCENARYSLMHGMARQRITPEEVLEIRRRNQKGESCKDVYKDYATRMSFSAFAKAYRGYTWKHVR